MRWASEIERTFRPKEISPPRIFEEKEKRLKEMRDDRPFLLPRSTASLQVSLSLLEYSQSTNSDDFSSSFRPTYGFFDVLLQILSDIFDLYILQQCLYFCRLSSKKQSSKTMVTRSVWLRFRKAHNFLLIVSTICRLNWLILICCCIGGAVD
jgi:tRNA nucleotidyltransferase/poly(A) polymerase